jgi:hypothetical protein
VFNSFPAPALRCFTRLRRGEILSTLLVALSSALALSLTGCPLVSDADLAVRFDQDGDGVPRPTDCDDDDAAAGAPSEWYADPDGDGFGGGEPTTRCSGGEGFVAVAGDCDDGDPLVFPGADERCDGADDDCDGVVDGEAVDATSWHPDADGDGRGDAETTVAACEAPAGWIADDGDCNDDCATCWSGAVEACGDGVDNDCDGVVAGACALSGDIPVADAAAILLSDAYSKGFGAPGDVDGDGRDDLLLADHGGAWLVSDIGATTRERGAAETRVCGPASCAGNAAVVAAGRGDADGDGRGDVLFGQYGSGAYIVTQTTPGEMDARTGARFSFPGYLSAPQVVDWIGDWDGDGTEDILITSLDSSGGQPEAA